MTIEECKNWIKEINAFAEGKVIQWRDFKGKWYDATQPSWKITEIYRIKPESEYVPFEDSDNWREYFRGRWIRDKETKYEVLVIGLDDNFEVNDRIEIGEEWLTFDSVFNDFENLDGSPLGKIKE
jgi:hypothetical protein